MTLFPLSFPFGFARRAVVLAAALGVGVLALVVTPGDAAATVRLKDVIDIEGVRDNMLVGYGLVIGVRGTGDSIRNAPFTGQSLTGMLERMGVNTRGASLDTKNIAAVMVTATLPAFAAQGTRIDVSVGAMGDATSLQGGDFAGDAPGRRRRGGLCGGAGAGLGQRLYGFGGRGQHYPGCADLWPYRFGRHCRT